MAWCYLSDVVSDKQNVNSAETKLRYTQKQVHSSSAITTTQQRDARRDMRCCFNIRSRLSLTYSTEPTTKNYKTETNKLICSEVSVNSRRGISGVSSEAERTVTVGRICK